MEMLANDVTYRSTSNSIASMNSSKEHTTTCGASERTARQTPWHDATTILCHVSFLHIESDKKPLSLLTLFEIAGIIDASIKGGFLEF